MLSKEFITEKAIHRLDIGNIFITVDSHYSERAQQRKVPHKAVGYLLATLSKVSDQIAAIPEGQQFWVYRPAATISIGARKNMNIGDKLHITLKTVILDPPFDGPTPVIEV
jgi:ABC-type lipopolysaccharide export system ATPase subunit